MDHHPALNKGLIQVAGIQDLEEATMLVEAGVDLIGIPLRLTVNAEDLGDADAARICHAFPGRCCLITYLNDVSEIEDLVRFLGASHVQLHGDVDPAILPVLKARMPDICLIKSLVVGKGPFAELLDTMQACAPAVDAFITDTFDAGTGAEGATGKLHDWEISRRLRELSPCPVILAGGLNAGNVANGIAVVHPFGVDVHTGVEDAMGRKDRKKIISFIAAARTAFSQAKQGNP